MGGAKKTSEGKADEVKFVEIKRSEGQLRRGALAPITHSISKRRGGIASFNSILFSHFVSFRPHASAAIIRQ